MWGGGGGGEDGRRGGARRIKGNEDGLGSVGREEGAESPTERSARVAKQAVGSRPPADAPHQKGRRPTPD